MNMNLPTSLKAGGVTPCAPGLRDSAAGRGLPAAGTGRAPQAFTLVELLVVIAIIGIVAGISVPAFKNMQKADAEAAATRQLVDEVANARQRAISSRSDVYMVFIPPAPADPNVYFAGLTTAQERQQATNLLRGQYSSYSFYSDRSVGDQPGQFNPRYLAEWRFLPQGTFIASNKFFAIANSVTPFWYKPFPFPDATSPLRSLPYIGFDYQGRVFHEDATGEKVYSEDAVIPLARGTVSSPSGASLPVTATVEEKPPGNSITASNHIRVDWLTGRGSVERQQISGN